MGKPRLRLVTPATIKRTVMPRRRPNAELRRREHLTEVEVERLMEAAKGNRWGLRDAAMVLVAYRHGLRAAELVDLRWDQVGFETGTLHVRRVKKGTPATHPILGDELRALRRLRREQTPKAPFVFTSERGAPFTTAGFARIVEHAGSEAKLGFKVHPRMLRPHRDLDGSLGRHCRPTRREGLEIHPHPKSGVPADGLLPRQGAAARST